MRVLVSVVLAACLAVPVAGQEGGGTAGHGEAVECVPTATSASPGSVPAYLAGGKVRVTAPSMCARPVVGWLLATGDTVVVGDGRGEGVGIPLERVVNVERSLGRSAGRGALRGAGIGLLLGFGCIALCADDGGANLAPMSFSIVGAAAGAVLLKSERWQPVSLAALGRPTRSAGIVAPAEARSAPAPQATPAPAEPRASPLVPGFADHPLEGRIVRLGGPELPREAMRLERVGGDSLHLLPRRGGEQIAIRTAALDRLDARRPATRVEGATRWGRRGFAIGFVGAGVLCAAAQSACRLEADGNETVENPLAIMVLNGVGSAFYGALGGALLPGHRWESVPLGPHVAPGTRVRLGVRAPDGSVRLATGAFVRDVPGSLVVHLDGAVEPVTLRWDEIVYGETSLGRPPVARNAVPLAGVGAFLGASTAFATIFGWSCESHLTRAECEKESNRLVARALLGGAAAGAGLGTVVALTLPREDRWRALDRPLNAARVGVSERGAVVGFEF